MPATTLATPEPHESSSDAAALDDMTEIVARLRRTNDKIAGLTKLQADLQRTIKARLGEVEIGTIAGRPVVTWKRTLRVAVSQKLLKERYPQIVRNVSDITEVRTFKVLGK
jgi:predicted phage-related endonuclease